MLKKSSFLPKLGGYKMSRKMRKSFVASDNYFGYDCSMFETLYHTIFHDPSF